MFYLLTLSVVGFILCSLCSIYPKLIQDLSNSKGLANHEVNLNLFLVSCEIKEFQLVSLK